MSMKTLVLALAIAASITLPLATANHGLNGRLVGQLSDGTAVEAKIVYLSGNGNTQTFRFGFTLGSGASFTCNGFGSIEVGFVSVGCATSWSTGATNHFHAYPSTSVDMHDITVTIAGVSGTATQIICADGGATAAGCNNAFGLAPI